MWACVGPLSWNLSCAALRVFTSSHSLPAPLATLLVVGAPCGVAGATVEQAAALSPGSWRCPCSRCSPRLCRALWAVICQRGSSAFSVVTGGQQRPSCSSPWWPPQVCSSEPSHVLFTKVLYLAICSVFKTKCSFFVFLIFNTWCNRSCKDVPLYL